jgi:hypothetical protein
MYKGGITQWMKPFIILGTLLNKASIASYRIVRHAARFHHGPWTFAALQHALTTLPAALVAGTVLACFFHQQGVTT